MGRYKYFPAKSAVRDLITDAHSDIEELAEEMGSWRDNMEGTAAENAPSYEIVTETAGTLEDQEDPTSEVDSLPQDLQDTQVTWQDVKVTSGRQKTPSRAVRCSQVCHRFTTAAEAMRDWLPDVDDTPEDLDVSGIESLADTLEEIAGNIEGLEFPGMYG